MFSPELAVAGTVPNTRLDTPTWKAVIDDCDAISGRKLGFDWQKMLRFILLSLIVLWGTGTLLSLIVNRTQIYEAQETARQAADTAKPLAERLHNQLVLQQAIARLQHREATGAPWYTRFGLNQDSDTLAALWPLYAKNNVQLMRDTTADHLRQQLNAFVQLPPASDARTQGTQHTYDVLKSYLMLARPDKADADWLAKNVLKALPKRQNVPDGTWQDLAPKLLGFYARNLPAHPEWKIKPDAELISTVRQILLKQIGQRNAESGLYQDMLKRVASNWPDLTLADMTGDTDATTVFSTDEVVPGMFTRQAWEEQVQDAINEVVKTRRDEIDWVLTDKMHQTGSDISPEALKARLTERYFTDFGNAWLNMVNSIQWQEATSLSEAIAQLSLIGDVRQSPLVALMNTLAWQGKTGQKGEALADSIVDSAKKLIGQKKNAKQFIEQAQGPEGPLDGVFGPLPPTVRTTFLGVYGVDSPLPTSYLDDIAQRREGHEAVTSFLDIFSHRITTQYYRIWRKYAYPATFEAGGRDATSQCLLGLVGLGIPGTAEQVATPVSRFLALLGTMRLPTRNAEGIRALVSLLAPNTRAIITEPDPVKVHIDNPSGLGAGNRIRLSQRATLGKTAKEACSRVLVTLETEDPAEAEGWLPGGVLHTDLLVLLRVYLGYRSDARLRLTVPVRLLPEPRLGKGRRIQLGRTGLLGLKEGKLSNDRETLTVSLGRYEGLQCSAFSPAEDGHYRFD